MGFPVSHDEAGRYSLRLLRSVDFPVDRLILVLNLDQDADPEWLGEALRLQPSLEVVRPRTNLGCAGGWNTVIQTAPSAPYWLVLNNDVAFPPGALRKIAWRVADDLASDNRSSGGSPPVFMRSFALRGGVDNLPAFVLSRQAVAEVGLFDENFWPVYGEDEDYFARMRIVGRGVHVRDESVVLIHGPEDWDPNASGHYSGSGHFITENMETGLSTLEGLDGSDPSGPGSASALGPALMGGVVAGGAAAALAAGQVRRPASVLHRWLLNADNGKLFCLKYGPRPSRGPTARCWSTPPRAWARSPWPGLPGRTGSSIRSAGPAPGPTPRPPWSAASTAGFSRRRAASVLG